MTDSGFSSVASNRSAPATIKPSLLNPIASGSNRPPSKETGKENVVCTSVQSSLPKPSPLFHLSKPGLPNRFFGSKGNGNYSPSLYSPKEMSPMSCLAYDFRDLNTSRDATETPRKRLSLSSVSSLESFHIRSQPSPATKSSTSAVNSPPIMNDDVVNAERIAPMEIDVQMQNEAVLVQKKRIELFKPKLSTFSIISSRSISSALRLCDSSELSEDVGCISLLDQAAKGENYFFKPISKGCFADMPSPVDLSEMEAKLDERAMQDRDANVMTSSSSDAKQLRFRRFKSMPSTSKHSNFRSRMWSNRNNGKENSPVFPCGRQSFSKGQGSIDSPSPLHPMVTSTSPGFSSQMRRNSSYIVSPKLTSSPLVTNFSSSSSSAFSSVSPPSLKQPTLSKSQSERQEELRKSAEEVLRDAKSPTNSSLTPEKSVVPGSISSLSARTTRLSRPASVSSFCREKSPLRSENLSPILIRANKRTLDTSNTSMAAARKRLKQNSTSELTTTRRKMAFLSKDRKVKSADVTVHQLSPISTFKSGFRPISAPALTLSDDDDDTPLSHSRLCSSNDSDSDDSDDVSMMLEQSQQLADEQLVEAILADNTRARKSDQTMTVGEDTIVSAPDGIYGLITAPLLVSSSKAQTGPDVDERLPRPRELFRSPSAPPLVTRRRSLMTIQRSTHHCESDTPGGRRSCVCIPETSAFEASDEEPNAILNRSRSFNELDVMKAVELGCSGDNLIGDFSRVCSLETVTGKCQDLKYITAETLMDLIDHKQDVGCFEIIDCRYPYEYDGGHIRGALSVWEEEVLYKKFLQNSRPMWAAESNGSYKPPVLVFYCEFSSERGPKMARALRSKDRSVNSYPHLHYPEIYVLRNGYKNFYNTEGTKEYCHPQSYRPMAHRDFTHELRKCRIKSKSWGAEKSGVFSRLKKRF